MALCPGDTTQWDDIHRRLGNFKPLVKEPTVASLNQKVIEAVEEYDPLEHRSLDELNEIEDVVEEDDLARLRRERLAELKKNYKAAKFGEVRDVGFQDFVKEVTEGSRDGQWVIVLLYFEGHPGCQRMLGPWVELARRFPAVKFMRGIADKVVPKFPEGSAPTVLVYRNEDCQKQIVGMTEWGGASRVNADCMEWVLKDLGVVTSDLEEDPRQIPAASAWRRPQRDEDESDQEDDRNEDRGYSSSRLQTRLDFLKRM